jgi:hypothetical protein
VAHPYVVFYEKTKLDLSLVGLGTCRLCCFVIQSQYLAEVSNTFPMKISLLLFSAEPGFVTISFRHKSLPRESYISVQTAANLARSFSANRLAWNKKILS